MATQSLNFGIPDIELSRRDGGTFNPAHFVGHELIVLFLPSQPMAAARELADFAQRTANLSDEDAWFVAICRQPRVADAVRDAGLPIVSDPLGRAWSAFRELVGPNAELDPVEGAVFLFGRGGCLRRVWNGCGHSADVFRELPLRTVSREACPT